MADLLGAGRRQGLSKLLGHDAGCRRGCGTATIKLVKFSGQRKPRLLHSIDLWGAEGSHSPAGGRT